MWLKKTEQGIDPKKIQEVLETYDKALDYYEMDKSNNNKEKNCYDELYENNTVDFFVMNKKNKELLIELFISFVNNSKTYESLYIQPINLENIETCTYIKDIFNYFSNYLNYLVIF